MKAERALRFLYMDSPLGVLKISENGAGICGVSFSERKSALLEKHIKTPLLEKAELQLSRYFWGKRSEFDLPLSFVGTDFCVNVWKAVMTIPCGETRSYRDIAEAVGNPKACRAVGMAVNKNPIAIIVPCHRVVGSDGGLTGYAGGLDRKKYLLDLERKYGQ